MIVDSVLENAKAYMRGEIVECSLAVNDGKFHKIGKETSMPKADEKIKLKGLLVLPGLIDSHVHLRDEGKAYKEDFLSGTAAAAAGGMATVLDMPNNDPVTMSPETLRDRSNKAESKVLVNVGFFSEFPKRTEGIGEILKCGAVAFKLFMAEQVGGLNIDDDNILQEAFRTTARLDTTVAVHAEDKTTLRRAEEELRHTGHNDIGAFLQAHSTDAEVKAVERLLNIARETRARVHFCHVSTKDGLQAIANAKKTGTQATCETTPHNLLLTDDDLRRIGTLAMTMPPVRDRNHITALWNGVAKGQIDSLGSDHAPHKLEEKETGSVWNAKVGIPGLETTLPLLLTEVNRGRLSIGDIVRLMAEKPAEIYGLDRKGSLKTGNDADLTVVNLYRKHKIDSSCFKSKAKFSPFDGWLAVGKPEKTFASGQLIMDEGNIVAKAGSGKIIRRELH